MSETLEQVVERVVREAAERAAEHIFGRPAPYSTEAIVAQFLPMMLKLAGRVGQWRKLADHLGQPVMHKQLMHVLADELESTLREMMKISKDNI